MHADISITHMYTFMHVTKRKDCFQFFLTTCNSWFFCLSLLFSLDVIFDVIFIMFFSRFYRLPMFMKGVQSTYLNILILLVFHYVYMTDDDS